MALTIFRITKMAGLSAVERHRAAGLLDFPIFRGLTQMPYKRAWCIFATPCYALLPA